MNIYRSFDISESDIISITRDCEQQFDCIIEFDSYNRTISIKSMSEIGENKGLIISDKNLLKQIEKNIKTTDIVTRLNLYGNDGLTIASINPTGKVYKDNFNMYRTLKYMPQSLLDAFDDYDDLVISKTSEYNLAKGELLAINNKINFANGELDLYKSQLDIILQNIQTCYDTSDNISEVGGAISTDIYKDIIFDGMDFVITSNEGSLIHGSNTYSRISSTTPYALNKIAYDSTLGYVAISNYGYIYYSSNLTTWNKFNVSNPKQLNGICYGNSKFVIVGDDGRIYSSTTPSTSWSVVNLGAGINLNSVIWDSNNNIYISVGDGGKIYTSINGTSWTLRTSNTTVDLYNVISNNSIIVAIGYNGVILTSTDGITWNSVSSGTSEFLYGICWTGSLFVIVGTNGKIITSSDGSTWNSQISNTTNNLYSVAYGNGYIYAIGEHESRYESTNGTTWVDSNIFNFDFSYWKSRENFKKTQITNKQTEITNLNTDKTNKENTISSIYQSLEYKNNFNSQQLAIIVDLINEDSITVNTDNINDLNQFGEDYLAWKAQPLIEFNITIPDIFSSKEYQHDWAKIKIGDLINLDYSNFAVNMYEVRLMSYTHNVSSNSLTLQFSNKDIIDSDDANIIKIMNNLKKSSTTIDVERSIYKDYSNDKTTINNYINSDTINTADKQIDMNGNKITKYGIESTTDDDYNIVITKNKIIMAKNDGSSFYAVVSPNGLCSSAVNQDRIVVDYNGLTMFNSDNQKHGIVMDKANINRYADLKIFYNGNEAFQIYNAVDNIIFKFYTHDIFRYSIYSGKMYGEGNHDYISANITNTVKHLTQAEIDAKTDWLENQLVEITDEVLPLVTDLEGTATLTDVVTKVNSIINALDGWMLRRS